MTWYSYAIARWRMHQGTHLSESEETPNFPNMKSDLTIQKIEILVIIFPSASKSLALLVGLIRSSLQYPYWQVSSHVHNSTRFVELDIRNINFHSTKLDMSHLHIFEGSLTWQG